MSLEETLGDAQAMRNADRELLSLALMQSRNRSLAWLALLEHLPEAQALAGRMGWWQERWIARNLQRARGPAAALSQAALASIEPRADDWWSPAAPSAPAPGIDILRAYLAETLELTLELLARAANADDSLHWFRAALFEEDARVLAFAALAQAYRVAPASLLPEPVLRPVREPLWFPAQAWSLGSAPGGYVPANEQWAHEEAVPAFEVDAQPVTWQQFAEFVADGGYDDASLWSGQGAAWLEGDGRRTPRDVEQLRHGVMLQRFGTLVRAPMGGAASMLCWHEADAWCRWAGRRLPTELEWELAASRGMSRGMCWGQLPEWTAGRARAWPGGAIDDAAALRVQRGLAWFEPRRLAHPKARRFVAAERDDGFAGFRSCAV